MHGTSLVVQWLGLCTFTATVWVQSLVGELRSHKPCGAAKESTHKDVRYVCMFRFFPIIGYYKMLSAVPCAVQ